MTAEIEPNPVTDASTKAGLRALSRLLALSGIAFEVQLASGWFLSGGDAPDSTAANADWIDTNRRRSVIGAFIKA